MSASRAASRSEWTALLVAVALLGAVLVGLQVCAAVFGHTSLPSQRHITTSSAQETYGVLANDLKQHGRVLVVLGDHTALNYAGLYLQDFVDAGKGAAIPPVVSQNLLLGLAESGVVRRIVLVEPASAFAAAEQADSQQPGVVKTASGFRIRSYGIPVEDISETTPLAVTEPVVVYLGPNARNAYAPSTIDYYVAPSRSDIILEPSAR